MKSTITKFVIYALGLFCGVIFLLINVSSLNPTANKLIKPRAYGDLYYSNYVDKYKEELKREIPFSLSKLNTPLKKAGLILYGDSFSNLRYFKGLPELLIDSMKTDVHFAHPRTIYQGPILSYLGKSNYQKDNIPKFLIFESIERAVAKRLRKEPKLGKPNNAGKSLKARIKSIFPTNVKRKYGFFFKDGIFTNRFYSYLMNKRFEWFGYMDAPKYKDENSGMLFADITTSEDISGFYYPFADEEIALYCNHLEILSNELKSNFNLDFIFMPVPNKYSIYHELINQDEYNNLLPRLYECMEAKGIDFVDIYHPLKEQKELMYFKTDTHWNEKGAQLSHNLLMKKIREIQARTNSKN